MSGLARLLVTAASQGSLTASWDAIAATASKWAAARQPRSDDVPLTLYRDANAWCPFCHRVFYFMEQKGLRYHTERIHLGGDPREPPKQTSYLREVAPRGNVPALRIRDEVILESLDILRVLEREFPDEHATHTDEDRALEDRLVHASGAFDTDCDDWLHNVEPRAEAALQATAHEKLAWLEDALGARPGPFFLGERAGVADAAFVGFLTRTHLNYAYFKSLDVASPASGYPRLAAWLQAVGETPGGLATAQEAGYEQRIYQAHPERRAAAEPCMALHPTRLGVGEPREHCPPRPLAAAALQAGSGPALEAAWQLHERREALGRFLLRKRREAAGAAGSPPRPHWKRHSHRAPEPPPPAVEEPAALAAVERDLLALASVLTAQCTPAQGAALAGGVEALQLGAVASLGGLVGTPRDMSAAAAAELRAALAEMLHS